MKINNLIPLVIVIGVCVLFFFPEPEKNFPIYFGILLVFIGIVFLLYKLNKNSFR